MDVQSRLIPNGQVKKNWCLLDPRGPDRHPPNQLRIILPLMPDIFWLPARVVSSFRKRPYDFCVLWRSSRVGESVPLSYASHRKPNVPGAKRDFAASAAGVQASSSV